MQEKLQNSLLDIGDYLSMGWSEFTKNFQTFLIFTLLINLPLGILSLFLPTSEEPAANEIRFLLLFVLLSVVLGILSALAAYKVIERSILQQNLSAIQAIKKAFPKIFIAIVVSIIVSIPVGIGFLLLLIPGIWLGTMFSFVLYAVALRNCGMNAMSYSWSVVKGRWWAVFGRTVLLGFCFAVLMIPLAIVFGIINGLLNLANIMVIAKAVELISNLVISLVSYYFAAAYTLIFLNFDYTRNLPSELQES